MLKAALKQYIEHIFHEKKNTVIMSTILAYAEAHSLMRCFCRNCSNEIAEVGHTRLDDFTFTSETSINLVIMINSSSPTK